MHTPILPSRAPKPNVIDTERNSFTINVINVTIKLSGIPETVAGQNVSERMD